MNRTSRKDGKKNKDDDKGSADETRSEDSSLDTSNDLSLKANSSDTADDSGNTVTTIYNGMNGNKSTEKTPPATNGIHKEMKNFVTEQNEMHQQNNVQNVF